MKSLLKFIQIHRQVTQYPTWYSALVVVLLFGLFLEAYMHNFNLVYITLFFVFALAFSAGHIGLLNIGYLEANFLYKSRFFANEEGSMIIEVKNRGSVTSWSVLLHSKDNFVEIGELKPDNSKVLSLPFTPKKRGTFTQNEFYFDTLYPLSTVRLYMPICQKFVFKIFAFPSKKRKICEFKEFKSIAYPEPKGKSLKTFLAEEEKYYGEEKEFDGLREYDGSQKISHIHWASVAKEETSVKFFIKETQTQNLSFNFYRAGKNDEARLSQLSLWVLECEKQHLPFTINMPKGILDTKKESIDEILEKLALY